MILLKPRASNYLSARGEQGERTGTPALEGEMLPPKDSLKRGHSSFCLGCCKIDSWSLSLFLYIQFLKILGTLRAVDVFSMKVDN